MEIDSDTNATTNFITNMIATNNVIGTIKNVPFRSKLTTKFKESKLSKYLSRCDNHKKSIYNTIQLVNTIDHNLYILSLEQFFIKEDLLKTLYDILVNHTLKNLTDTQKTTYINNYNTSFAFLNKPSDKMIDPKKFFHNFIDEVKECKDFVSNDILGIYSDIKTEFNISVDREVCLKYFKFYYLCNVNLNSLAQTTHLKQIYKMLSVQEYISMPKTLYEH